MLNYAFTFKKLITLVLTALLMTGAVSAQTKLVDLPPPVSDGAREPNLSRLPDGRILLSWTEPDGADFAVKTSILDGNVWSAPQTVVQADDLFVNWADFPSVAAFADGTWAAHWLQYNGTSSYQYDVKVTLSPDEGMTWGTPFTLHDDRSQTEHGFVSFQPFKQEMMAVWLDAGSYDNQATDEDLGNAMQLRARTLSSKGALGPDMLLDARTCTCCQTSAAATEDGDILSVYRDRSPTEIRDIALVRLKDGDWSQPTPVANDGWEINGCPVNGPAIDAQGSSVAVAWFTAADDQPAVNVAFSNDGGLGFEVPLQVDLGEPQGRVDILMRDAGSAIVSWVEYTQEGEAILICEVTPTQGCLTPLTVATSNSGPSIGFPRIALGKEGVFLAWTAPKDAIRQHPQGGTTIKVEFLRMQ
jgi:hypothetical protein